MKCKWWKHTDVDECTILFGTAMKEHGGNLFEKVEFNSTAGVKDDE